MHKSDMQISQIQETIDKIDTARVWVEKAELSARTKLEELEESFPDLLARRALGEASRGEVAEHRNSIARLRESIAECALALAALERRRNVAHDELRAAKRHQNNSRKNEPDPDKTIPTINKETNDRGNGETEAAVSVDELKAELEKRNISTNRFSKALGCSQSFLSRIFRGEKRLPDAMAVKAQNILASWPESE